MVPQGAAELIQVLFVELDVNGMPEVPIAETELDCFKCDLSRIIQEKIGSYQGVSRWSSGDSKAGSLSLANALDTPVVRSDSRRFLRPAAGCAVNATKCPAA